MSEREEPNVFYRHLDICHQCQWHVFDLCPVGAQLLFRAAVDQTPRSPEQIISDGVAFITDTRFGGK